MYMAMAPSERRGCGVAITSSTCRLLLFVCLCLVDPAGGRLYEAGKSVVIFGELACESLDFVAPGTGAASCDCNTPVTGSVIYIEEGYVQGDLLSCPKCAALGLTVTFQSETGTLTIKGRASLGKHTQAIAGVEFRAASSATDYRITYNYGHGTYSKDTGHFYDFFPISDGKCEGECTWPDAQAACAKQGNDLLGLIGYLVTVTSVEESAFAIKALKGQGWMGAADLTEGDWRWVTGPEGNMGASPCKAYDVSVDGPQRSSCDVYPLARTKTPCPPTKECQNGVQISKGFENWSGSEPNDYSNACGGSCATTGEDFAHFYPKGQWNDYPYQSNAIEGYVCEWGGIGEMCIDPKHVHGTDKLVPECGSHKDENECKTELPVGICEWDQAAMRCVPGYCRRHTTQAPCESDPSNNGPCMWSATDGCLPDPCVPLDSTACSQDTRCTPGTTPGTCTPVACMKYSPADVCTSQPGDACVWVSGDPHGCIQNPCVTYTTAVACNTDRTCTFDTTTGKCVQAICVRRHAQKLPCDADAHCMWVQDVTECIVDPCVDYNATACATDARCLYTTGTSTCEPTECVKKWSRQATCDADTSCMWSLDLVGCIANPCNGLDTTQCALDTRCKTGPGSTCVTDKCMMHTQQAKCTADPADKCVWAGGVAPGCIDDPCANYTSTTCVTDSTCKVDSTGKCVVDPCVVKHTQKTPCDADAQCMWVSGTQQCINNPCAGNTAQQTCTDDPLCDYDSSSMKCNPTTCAATHTQQSACDADTACMWSLDLVGCIANPCNGLDTTQCALDTRCKTGPGSTCVTDKCMMHTQQAKCTADPADKCVWAGGVAPGCIDDPCANYTSTTCVTDSTCKVDSTGKCVADPCVVKHTQKTPCDADAQCMWATGTQQCIDNPCAGNTAQQTCTDDPLCDYDSSSMKCNPTTCAATHTQQSACDADTACMWSLDLVGCIANPCNGLDTTQCALDTRCKTGPGSTCVTDKCMMHTQQAKCTADPADKCVWAGGVAPGCIDDPCANYTSTTCVTDSTCKVDSTGKCVVDPCVVKHTQKTPCDADAQCMWVSGTQQCIDNPCAGNTAQQTCTDDPLCDYDSSSMKCNPTTCAATHTQQSACDADTACMWSLDLVGCIANPCNGLDTTQCALDTRCKTGPGSTCVTDKCMMHTQQAKCTADPADKCVWAGGVAPGCIDDPCANYTSTTCVTDSTCKVDSTGKCVVDPCVVKHTQKTPCDADAQCMWVSGTQQCIDNPCAGNTAQQTCTDDPLCDYDSSSMKCNPTTCAATHTQQSACDADTACMWSLDLVGCIANPCNGLDTTQCALDTRCKTGPGSTCVTDKCMMHTQQAKCTADPADKCVWAGGVAPGCIDDPCANYTSTTCVTDSTCKVDSTGKCVVDPCVVKHTQKTPCDADAQCMWVSGTQQCIDNPCAGNTAQQTCTDDPLCDYDSSSMKCNPTTCAATHTQQSACDADTACMWSLDLVGCIANPCNGLDATQCALDTRCKTGPGSTCVTDKCMMHTQQAKCTADPADKCVWAGGVAPGCIDDPCANYTSTTCVTDSTCKVDSTGKCVVDPCVVKHTQKTPCDADAQCMWVSGTQQCIDNPCAGNTAQQTCTDDPLCDYDSSSMKCNPTTCAATHTQQSACDADTACMWSLDLVGCIANPCNGLDATQCALDTRCKTGPGSTCVTDKCMMHTQQAKCTADPADKCVWAGGVAPGCIDDPCANYTSTTCVTDSTCKVDSTGKCVVDPCVVKHTQKTPCDADSACMWVSGTQQCIDNPCAGNTAQQTCTDDPLCDYDSSSMKCNPTTCAATHTQQSACDADTACMWSLDLVGCIANPCNGLDTTQCALDTRCKTGPGSTCVTDKCMMHTQQAKCTADPADKCVWAGGVAPGCIDDPCANYTSTTCVTDSTCKVDSTGKCVVDPCVVKHTQKTPCDADSACMWVSGTQQCIDNPCAGNTAQQTCTDDPLCDYDSSSMKCNPTTCAATHTQQSACDADTACMWSLDLVGCIANPCNGLDTTQCALDTRCKTGPGSTCVTDKCMMHTQQAKCTADPADKCVWAGGVAPGCIDDPCANYTSTTCVTDSTCKVDSTGKCVVDPCVVKHTQKTPCDADAQCMWVSGTQQCIDNPCAGNTAQQTCTDDPLCDYDSSSMKCNPTTCAATHTQQSACDADTACMWSLDLVGCIANPCNGLDATQCALDTRCKTGPGSTCVTDKCMMHTQQAKCTADPADKCVWAGGVAPGCIDDPCANYTSTTCVTDSTCKVDSTGKCVADPCVVKHTQKTPCDADAQCMWVSGTQQCIDNPCAGNTAQQTCTDDPLCDYDSSSMKCNPTTCAATHTQQSACDADTACMWSLDLVGCIANPCNGLDTTQCALDTRCKTGPGSTCVTDKCMMHTQQAKCTADPADKCVWAGGVAPGCIDDPCANYTSTTCVTDSTCKVDSTGKCVVDPCVVKHTQKTPCDADAQCMWVSGTQQCIDNPCAGNTAQQTCTDDPLCDYDSSSMKCNPTTCAATHTQQSACDADTACMWSLDLVGCIANPCSTRLSSASCDALASCLWVTNSSSCIANPCYELPLQQCLSDLRCQVATSDSKCQPTRCFRSYDNSPTCQGDAGCQWASGMAACVAEVCRGRAAADCDEDIRCAFDADKGTCTEVECMTYPQGTCRSAPTACMWVADPSGCTANPCPAQKNATDCAADLRCTWLASSSRCGEAKTCMTTHATRGTCDADAACMWSVDARACQPDPCASLSGAAACAADPRCERPSGACTSVRCARRYTRATACDADAGCAWDADDTSACLPRALTCAAMAQLSDACAGDLRCSWTTGTGCAEVGCAARHGTSRATCDADVACVWRGDGVEGCVAAPCRGYVADAAACAADKRCAFDGARCQGTSCADRHITQPRCDDDASCLWGLDGRGCVEAPCRSLNTSACTADSRCRVDGASCTEATCYRAHTRRAQCGSDASCAWVAGGGGGDGCTKDPCAGRAAAACMEDPRCLSVGDARATKCVPQPCFAAHATERVCNAAAGCEWVRAGADGHGCGPEPGVTVVATPCFGVSEEACKGDARCVYSDGSCAERECMARHKSEEPCNDDSECIWRTEPLGCVPDNGHFKFKKGVVVIGTVGMVFSGATGIGHAGSLTIATLSCFQHVEDKFTFLLHPTGIEVGDNLLAGAIVGNLAIIVGFTLVCRLLVACLYSPAALRATSCVSLHNDTQASLFFPSSALLIFQWLFQGLALAAMVLVVRLPAVWSGALGFTTLVVCMGVPVWVFRQLKSNVPRSACYINDDIQPRGRLLTILCGPGEWVSHYRKQHWVKRYAAVLLPFKQAIPWFSFWQFCQYLALCAVNAIRTENYVQCGHVKVAAALLFLGMLALLLITKPYTRPRDMAMLPLYMVVMATGLVFEAVSYYTYDPTGVLFDVATGFFVAALIILLIKMVLDLLTAVFIICSKRRERLQQEWWATKSGDASLMLPDFPLSEQGGGSFYEQPPAAAPLVHTPQSVSDPGDLGGLGTAVAAPRSDEGALGGLGTAVHGSPDPTSSDLDASADGGLGTYVPPQSLQREGGGRGVPLGDAAPGSLGSLGVFVGPSEDTATSSAGPRSSSQHVSGGGGSGGGAVLNPYDDDGAGGSESPTARESSQPFLQPSEVPRTSVRASSEGLEVAEWSSYRRSIAGLPSVSASDTGLRELSPRGRGGGGGLQQHVI